MQIREIVDGDQGVDVDRDWLCLGGSPLAVERTVSSAGAHRPPVILVHGLAQNRYTWRLSRRSLCGYLAARGYEVLNVELRGHGLSRAWGAEQAVTVDDYVADLQRVVDRCDEVPFVVGHSLGGAAGIGVASRAPIRGLVHLAGVFSFARDNRALRAIAGLTLAWEPMLRRAPVRVRTAWVGRIISRLYQLTDIAGYGAPIAGWAPDSMERDLLDERLRLGFDWTSAEVWIEMSRWAMGENASFLEGFPDLDVPLLVMAGDADPLVSPDDARRCFEASLSTDKELLIFDPFDHRVHWGHIDLILGRLAPAVVWPRLGAWLDARCDGVAG